MIIAIVILSILVIALTIFSALALLVIRDLMPNLPVGTGAQEVIQCKVILSTTYNAAEEGILYDFSAYEKHGIVGLTALNVGPPKNPTEELIANIPVVVDGAKIFIYKDGSMIWSLE